MLGRGLRKRCPLCGSAKVFTSWFHMRDHCPGCGHRFERDSDFFFGAYVINLAITEGLLLLLAIVPLIALLASDHDVNIVPVLVLGLTAAIAAPLAFYPFSRTIWAAIDLILRPADAIEPSDRA
ncbi:MAG: hypothetical protein QOD63_2725 [Actinomycetota bacterium]|jgi:uncharacterized protein (DUF983 family)|nr:hypothetical protein [Actinomycetota bacterium]